MKTSGNNGLSADDIECLWAIARRGKMQDHLVRSRGAALEERGLIEISHGWPALTVQGRRLLNDLSAQTVLDLDRENVNR